MNALILVTQRAAICSAALLLGVTAATAQTSSPDRPAAPPMRAVTLAEALSLANRRNADLAAAQAQAEASRAAASRAWSAWLPQLTASGSYVHTSAPSQLDLGQIVGLVGGVYDLTPQNPQLVPAPVAFVGVDSVYGTLEFNQPLFSPQGLFLIQPARANARAAEFQALNAREQVLLGTARTWLGLQGISGLLDAAREAEAVALRREQDAKAQLAAGTAVQVALLRAQVETAQARAQIAELEGTREALSSTLEALTGEAVEPAKDAATTGVALPSTASEESREPWRNTFAVRAAEEQVRAAEGTLQYDNFSWLPSLSATARGNYNSNTAFTGATFSYDLIVALSLPLYDRGIRYASRREDRARLSAARSTLESALRNGRANWVAARARLQAAEAALAQAEAQVQLAGEAQKQVEAAYREGAGTSLELSDVDARRFFAASSAAQARAQVDIQRAELAAAEGRLASLVQAD
jgi:outer membrane protein